MIPEFAAFIDAFRQGKSLASSATWKNTQATTGALTALLGASLIIAKGFGYDIQIDGDMLHNLAAGVAAAYGVFSAITTVVTSDKVGLPPKAESGGG